MIKRKKEKDTKIDKQIKKYIPLAIWIGAFVLAFVMFYFLFHNLGKVNYEGISFVREKYGEILIYRYSYLTDVNGQGRQVNVLLRGNPAENNVSVNGEVVYPIGKTVYLSINSTGLDKGEDSTIAVASLSGFITNNGIVLKAGTPDKAEAQAKNWTYASCDNYQTNMVIQLQAADESAIRKVGQYCYKADVANCEVLPVIEKFIVQSIVDAKNAA